MFKKTREPQLHLFSSPSSLLSGKSQKIYDDKDAWHNQFRVQVTSRIDESLFKPLYCSDNGTPNASVRVLISMMVLKEAEGLSDQKLFENCRFNMLTRSAIGLVNANDPVPAESTYYLFRKRITGHAGAGNTNLLEVAFSQVTKSQCIDFEVSGKRIRMDSKLLGSNIAWLSRYELVHETLRLFYEKAKPSGKIDPATTEVLDGLLKTDGYKVSYTCSTAEVKTRLQQLGGLIANLLPLFSGTVAVNTDSYGYQTLERVFNEQFKTDENKIVIGRDNEEITARSVQSPHDTDCTYRNKDGNKVKGYAINITESCDDGEVLNLIGNVDVKIVSAPDTAFFQDGTNKAGEVFVDKPAAIHADGAYNSTDNQLFCRENEIELYLHAIQGREGRYKLELTDGKLSVLDTITEQIIDNQVINDKEGAVTWRIRTEKGLRYFTQKNIDACLLRKKIAGTPASELQKRNNVEATIFQLGYHYANAKSRYRGLARHQMWANIRCLWVNFVRIVNYSGKTALKTAFLTNIPFLKLFIRCFSAFNAAVAWLYPTKYFYFPKIQFSGR
jgi:hypothetical protein